jgi:hypothetical protein
MLKKMRLTARKKLGNIVIETLFQQTQPQWNHYPQVQMLCQMELTSHLLTNSVFNSVEVNEMNLVLGFIDKTLDNSLTLFDWDFCSLDLVNRWKNTGRTRNWLIPLKKTRSTK